MTQSVELLLDDAQDAAVRKQWASLAGAGLPSQARHTGETNRPHITLTVAAALPAYLETALKSALTGLLPVPVKLGGLLCFARRDAHGDLWHVLARGVVPDLELLELQATCAQLFERLPGTSPLLQPGNWSPHVTLARKLTSTQVGAALDVLGPAGESPGESDSESAGAGVEVRRWDGDARQAWLITRPRPA